METNRIDSPCKYSEFDGKEGFCKLYDLPCYIACKTCANKTYG